MKTITKDNYFDYAEAIHAFAAMNHQGQWSDLYSILSQSKFRPGPFWSETKVENENPVFHELTEDNILDLFNELNEYTTT